jgi:hypothetical protein
MAEKFLELQENFELFKKEFTKVDLDPTDPPDTIKIKTRSFAIAHLEQALNVIATLTVSAEKETTQLAAAKAIIGIAQGTTPKDEADPIKSLLQDIMNSDGN